MYIERAIGLEAVQGYRIRHLQTYIQADYQFEKYVMKCQIPSTSAFGSWCGGGGSYITWVTLQPVTTLWTRITTVISCKSDRKHRIDLTVKKLLNLTDGVNLRIAPRRPRVSFVLVISRRANCWAGWNRVHGNCASCRQFNRMRNGLLSDPDTLIRLFLAPGSATYLLVNEPLYFNWN